jgi:hypothetical protein
MTDVHDSVRLKSRLPRAGCVIGDGGVRWDDLAYQSSSVIERFIGLNSCDSVRVGCPRPGGLYAKLSGIKVCTTLLREQF